VKKKQIQQEDLITIQSINQIAGEQYLGGNLFFFTKLIKIRSSRDYITYSDIGGLSREIRELREIIEFPLTHTKLYISLGINPPKGVLLYGPPGTGKTLLSRALAENIEANLLTVMSAVLLVQGEGVRMIREILWYAREHQPCIIFFDEIDAIDDQRFSEDPNPDNRELQRTLLLELINQIDSFDPLDKVKIILATNQPPQNLNPSLTRPGRIDRKIEIPLPNEQARLDILKIHASKIPKLVPIDYEGVAKLTEGCNGADMRNICKEAERIAMDKGREYIKQKDFMKAARKVKFRTI